MIDVHDVDPMPENDHQASEADPIAAGTANGSGTDNSQGGGDDAPQDLSCDSIEPLPDLPSDDYGREFDEKLSIPVDRVVQATSVPGCSAPSVGGCVGVISVGRSSSFPLWKTAPARTKATRCGALTARQRAAAASMSL